MPFANGTQVGQFVTVDPNEHPDLKGQRLEITKVVGDGPSAKCAVRNELGPITLGRFQRYIAADELLPADAILKPGKAPRVVSTDAEEKVQMSAETKQLNLATTFVKEKGMSWHDATVLANRQLTDDESDQIRGGVTVASERSPSNSSEHSNGVMRLRAEVSRKMRDEGLSADDAVNAVLCEQLPDSGAVRFAERVATLKSGGLDDVMALRQACAEDPAAAEAYRVGF